MKLEIKSAAIAFFGIVFMFLYYLETTSKIIKISLKSLLFWRKDNDTIEKYSVAIEYETLVEMIEIPDHPWFVACQFHPEFKSTLRDGHPMFTAYMKAAVENAEQSTQSTRQKIKEQL